MAWVASDLYSKTDVKSLTVGSTVWAADLYINLLAKIIRVLELDIFPNSIGLQ